MNILCFGDSNTYGYKPDGTGRFDTDTRWTSLLQKKLGADHRVIEEVFVEEPLYFRMIFVRDAVDLI